jgi:hypothetical protein
MSSALYFRAPFWFSGTRGGPTLTYLPEKYTKRKKVGIQGTDELKWLRKML